MNREKQLLWDMLKLDYTLNKDYKGSELNYISLGGRDIDYKASEIMNSLRLFIDDIVKTEYSLTVAVLKLEYRYEVRARFYSKDMDIASDNMISLDDLEKYSVEYCKSELEKSILKEIINKQAERNF